MKKSVLIIVLVIVVLAGGAFALSKNKKNDTSTTSSTSSSSSTPSSDSNSSSSTATDTITYTNNGFSPSSITVKVGTKVTIKNNSSAALQFDSNPHPDHTDDPELNVGTISAGSSATVTVNNTGSHGYHNHLRSGDTGTIVVQ